MASAALGFLVCYILDVWGRIGGSSFAQCAPTPTSLTLLNCPGRYVTAQVSIVSNYMLEIYMLQVCTCNWSMPWYSFPTDSWPSQPKQKL